MKSKLIVVLLATVATSTWAISLKPEALKRMTYSQCMNDPTARFVAEYHKQRYPSASLKQILHLTCRDAGK
jgi:hypothetical protein